MTFEPLKSLIGSLEQQPHWQTRRQFYQVVQYWPKAVGHLVARQTRPMSIQRQVLYVSVSTAAWAQTLTFERRRILTQLNGWLTCPLSDLKFSAAQWQQQPGPRRRPDSELLRQHPSYVQPSADPDRTPEPSISESRASTQPASTQPASAQQAFANWSERVRASHTQQVLCPNCSCHCPAGELERWKMCALCATKQWQIRQPLG
ncbi:MAG: DUF721 domain-containing protein [Cyanobacteria bacterium J06632_22]